MFNRIFNADNPFWKAMGRIFDITELNLLWVLGCLPIVTIGASTTAFYYAVLNLQLGEEKVAYQDFFRSFRQNFKQGTVLGLIIFPLGLFLAADVWLARKQGPGIYSFFMVFFAVLFLLWAALALYAFPLLAKFDNTNKQILLLSFSLALKHLPQTVIMLAATGLALLLCSKMPFFVLIVFGFVTEFHCWFMAKLFKPMIDSIEGIDS